MSYHEQREEWIKKHPNATPEQAWTAGYMQATTNWVTRKR